LRRNGRISSAFLYRRPGGFRVCRPGRHLSPEKFRRAVWGGAFHRALYDCLGLFQPWRPLCDGGRALDDHRRRRPLLLWRLRVLADAAGENARSARDRDFTDCLGDRRSGRLGRPGKFLMIVDVRLSAIRETAWYEYLLRFGLGGAATVVAGLIAH